MSNTESTERNVTPERIMLVTFLVLSAVFIIEPVIADYPDDARVFPQLTASAVFIGSLLLLLQNYLPGPLYTFVAESVSITSSDESEVVEQAGDGEDSLDERGSDQKSGKDTLGSKYGYEVNETVFMVSTAVLYFVAGWAAGFLFVTPLYILGYTLWFRVNPIVGLGLAAAGTIVIYLFIMYLVMPFDEGQIFDFSPLVPTLIDSTSLLLRGGA